MWRYAVGLIILGVASAHFLNELGSASDDVSGVDSSSAEAGQQLSSLTREPRNTGQADYNGRTTRIRMDNRGHFVTTARMNGSRVEVLVDTGATSVAINRSTARRLGIQLTNSDFKYNVNTANGQTKAAAAIIDRIEIGRVEVRDVQAAILDDKALSGTLLGMSFLGQLKGFEVKNRELVLTQ